MTKNLSALVALIGIAGFGCSEEPASGSEANADGEATTPVEVVTVVIMQGPPGPAGPAGPAGPPGQPGRDGMPAPGAAPTPVVTEPVPAPTVTAPAGTGGAATDENLTILLGYDTDVPGTEASGNSMFLDAAMMPLLVTPSPGAEGSTTYAEFLIPFDGSAPQQFGWNTELPGGPMDLRGMELVIRLRWVSGFNPADSWGGLQIYAWSNEWTADISNGWTPIDPATRGMWVDYTLDLSTSDEVDAAPMFDPAAVNAIGYTFNTGGEAEDPPAATEALFQVDYVAVRPSAAVGVGGGGTGGTPAGGSGGTAGAAGAAAGAGGSAAGSGGSPAGSGGAAAGAPGTATDAGAP